MKTKFTLIIMMAMFFHGSLFSQFKLRVEISGLNNNKGQVLFQLLDENQKEIKNFRGEIQNNKSYIIIEGLKPAKYGFRYFHDENKNNKMDKTLVGIPEEGYGFSNNAKANFGPPAFEKWVFELKSDLNMTCKPTYLL